MITGEIIETLLEGRDKGELLQLKLAINNKLKKMEEKKVDIDEEQKLGRKGKRRSLMSGEAQIHNLKAQKFSKTLTKSILTTEDYERTSAIIASIRNLEIVRKI